jgi:NTE family protein
MSFQLPRVCAVTLLSVALWAPGSRAQVAPDPAATTSPRPKVGLVLGGGGARGAAHIGVLEVLEQLRIPVDCVAGTSMGALVAGAWAAGRSPAQMRQELAKADWGDMFQDNSDYAELNFRNKRLSQRFLPGTETGLTDRGAVGPPGVVLGQKIKLFFNHLVRADTGEPLIEQLPLLLSIVATDIGSGERVVFRDGSLTQAMRASMSVPGLMAPLEYRGRKLVDGGLVDNVPIREVRDRCGAQVVIAVNVGSPPLKAEDVSGLLSITAQMVALLTEQNVSASVAGLKPVDVLIKPDLGTINAGDFGRHTEAADRGRAAAQALAARLAPLAVDEARYAAWQRDVAVRERAVPRIDEVQVAGLLRADESLVMRWIGQQPGQPLDMPELTRDLGRAFGDGYYERIDYTVVREGQRQVLRVLPVEKSWGPNYLRFGVRLDSSLSQGSNYQLRAGYQRTWINRLGGELLAVADLGSTTGLSGEWYQPLTASQQAFFDLTGSYKRERVDYFLVEQRIAEYRSNRAQLEAVVGLNLPLLGQLRLGWREAKVTNELETGLDVLQVVSDKRYGGWLLGLDADRLDRLYFPRSGWATQASLFHSDRGDFSRLSLEVRGVRSVGDYVLGARASWVDSPLGRLPLQEAGRLGGFLNLTGFAGGQLLGDRVGYAHVRAERIIGTLPMGLRGDMRMGLALETGRVGQPYALQKRNGWLKSAALYVGGETPLGSVYLGVGQGSGGSTNAYLFIGTP